MKPNVARKNKQQSWKQYMDYVERRIAETDMAEVQDLCRHVYGVSIEDLAMAIAAHTNDCMADDIYEALRKEGVEY